MINLHNKRKSTVLEYVDEMAANVLIGVGVKDMGCP